MTPAVTVELREYAIHEDDFGNRVFHYGDSIVVRTFPVTDESTLDALLISASKASHYERKNVAVFFDGKPVCLYPAAKR